MGIQTTTEVASSEQTNESATSSSESREGLTPCVRYAEAIDDQDPSLTPIYADTPEYANFASPVYFATEDDLAYQEELDNPYAVTKSCVAKDIQDRAEKEGRVSYPIYAESDDIGDKGRYEVYQSLHGAVQEVFEVDPADCTWYFSGNRSIHAHLPLVAQSKEELEEVKEVVKEHIDDAEVTLDPQLYTRKRLFRLPGAEHSKTGYPKVEVDPNLSESILNRQIVDTFRAEVDRRSFLAVAESVGLEWDAEASTIQGERTIQYTTAVDCFSESLSPESRNQSKPPYLNDTTFGYLENDDYPSKDWQQTEWLKYNRHHFSPYANATERSIIVFHVQGGAFGRIIDDTKRVLIPSRIEGAISGSTIDPYTSYNQLGPVYLSEHDYKKYEKMDIERGDYIIMIGGRSRKSRLIRTSTTTAMEVATLLENKGRQAAFDHMDSEGIDIGESGKNGPRRHRRTNTQYGPSTAEKLKNKVDSGELDYEEDLHHNERVRIACHLLRVYDRSHATEWLSKAYGDDFDPQVTTTILDGLQNNENLK